ncbi:MAG: thiamine pyrophosphate-dependent dehydrogenase E1 component subunit alpha [Aromatoleum sp.]|jgi:pyruvate dehydrogenase E1 component alpha subunit|uniref:thiamine pyrophosphate-dependent dehydrogenase E1 component subunit alpha n=1 Tax=Aromatoleum sp. TaxID=2307007 RepID=UPI0028959ED0|nr:thiamine pyrophosphate-dependent dehydrogenase E1 component subunit alpha [Aromatoleum sp.]MDT3670999.1 thiamine pyrophosphate-dependent dehydrogenase E1 component subunit alpha [Aromatoleum sp.]
MSETNKPGKQVLLEIYRIASLIKQADDRFIELIKAGQIASPYYSPRGQELIPAAISVNLRADDTVVTTYRGIHDQLAKGIPLKPFVAELFGRATGTCKGKGGPMHVTHVASGLPVTTGIVGAGLPIANGLAWAAQLKGADQVTVVNFGDGASNIGAFHEALNLAAVWKLPVIFVCQNNGYAEHTRYDLGTGAATIADRAIGYGIPGVEVDGNDAVAMWKAANAAVARARAGEGPTLIEANTFRFRGHLIGDDSHYIPKDEMAAAVAADPLPRFRAWLIEQGFATDGQLVDIEGTNAAAFEEAVQFGLASPYPDISELDRDVVAEGAQA